MAHVSNQKKEQVADFVKLLKEYPIIGIINLENILLISYQSGNQIKYIGI